MGREGRAVGGAQSARGCSLEHCVRCAMPGGQWQRQGQMSEVKLAEMEGLAGTGASARCRAQQRRRQHANECQCDRTMLQAPNAIRHHVG